MRQGREGKRWWWRWVDLGPWVYGVFALDTEEKTGMIASRVVTQTQPIPSRHADPNSQYRTERLKRQADRHLTDRQVTDAAGQTRRGAKTNRRGCAHHRTPLHVRRPSLPKSSHAALSRDGDQCVPRGGVAWWQALQRSPPLHLHAHLNQIGRTGQELACWMQAWGCVARWGEGEPYQWHRHSFL